MAMSVGSLWGLSVPIDRQQGNRDIRLIATRNWMQPSPRMNLKADFPYCLHVKTLAAWHHSFIFVIPWGPRHVVLDFWPIDLSTVLNWQMCGNLLHRNRKHVFMTWQLTSPRGRNPGDSKEVATMFFYRKMMPRSK
jgi:hypothetical protein